MPGAGQRAGQIAEAVLGRAPALVDFDEAGEQVPTVDQRRWRRTTRRHARATQDPLDPHGRGADEATSTPMGGRAHGRTQQRERRRRAEGVLGAARVGAEVHGCEAREFPDERGARRRRPVEQLRKDGRE